MPLAWASHQFTDVPDGAQFHDDIAAVRGAGITSGCGPSIYCPTAGITREAMAAFIHRGFGRAGVGDTNEVAIGASFVDLGAVTISVGGVAGQTQFVKLDAAVTTFIESSAGCPCETAYARTIESARPILIVESNPARPRGLDEARRLLEMIEELGYVLYLCTRDGFIVRRPSADLQPALVVDYLAVPADRADDRALPEARAQSFDEDMAMMESEPFDSGLHVLHLCHAIVDLERRGAQGEMRLEGLKRRIVDASGDVFECVRDSFPPPLLSWLAR